MINNKFFVTVNPNAGAGKAGKHWLLIKEKLENAGLEFDFLMSEAHQQNINHVENAISEGYRKIIAVGGDGTLHNVVNGIMNQNIVNPSEIKVGMISVGTGNDWVRYHDIPKDYDKAIEVILKGETQRQDVGKMIYNQGQNHIHFMNFAGIGYDAYVVEHTAHLKKYGQSAYLYGLVQCLFKYDAYKLKVEVDGTEILNEEIFLMIAGIGQYAGGGMKLSPNAVCNDGFFELNIGKKVSKTDIILLTPKLFTGAYVEHEKVETCKAKHIKVTPLNDEVKAEADGELIGKGPFELSLVSNALQFYI
jgi:YegS/Rv2252/BmrU family lipid kinase